MGDWLEAPLPGPFSVSARLAERRGVLCLDSLSLLFISAGNPADGKAKLRQGTPGDFCSGLFPFPFSFLQIITFPESRAVPGATDAEV